MELYTVFYELEDGSEHCRIISAENREDAIETIEMQHGSSITSIFAL
jgi:hypothetical protein